MPPELPSEDISHLIEGLNGLQDVMRRAEQAQRDYRYRVAYAVRFRSEDLASLVLGGGMGVMCNMAVPVGRIVAKSRVPADYVHNFMVDYDPLELPSEMGILAQLRGRCT